FEIVLVPLDDAAILHGGVLDRHQSRELAVVDDETAHVLRQMARKADELFHQILQLLHAAAGRIEAELLQTFGADAMTIPPRERARELVHLIERETERLADVAKGTARTIADDGGGDGGAVAAVTLEDVLDHFLAALMFEVDVDVG